MGSGNVEGSPVTSLDLVEFDIFRFRNNFLQVSWIPGYVIDMILLSCVQTAEELKMRRVSEEFTLCTFIWRLRAI